MAQDPRRYTGFNVNSTRLPLEPGTCMTGVIVSRSGNRAPVLQLHMSPCSNIYHVYGVFHMKDGYEGHVMTAQPMGQNTMIGLKVLGNNIY